MARTQGLILFAVLTAGCSATKEIASSASIAASSAHSISERSAFIITHSAQPEIVAAAVTIKADAAVVLHETNQISVAVSGVKDIVPFWMTLIQWGLGAVVAVALVVLLWQTGIGTAIRVAIGWIPRRVQSEADLARQAMSSEDPTTVRELIAAKRAASPLFNAAFKESAK
jgi:hypothetical protein